MDLQQGFVLTRHWRDTAAGTEVEFWLATDEGPRRVRLAMQRSVAFVPLEQVEPIRRLIEHEREVELRPLALSDFRHRPVLGLYCHQHRQLISWPDRSRTPGWISTKRISGHPSDI